MSRDVELAGILFAAAGSHPHMCRRIECKECQKPTYAGCGAHIEQVLSDVPQAQRCHCKERTVAPAPGGRVRP